MKRNITACGAAIVCLSWLAFRPAHGQVEWTVLAYLSGDSELEEEAARYVSKLRSVPSCDDVEIVVQIDRRAGGYDGWGDFEQARRYVVTSEGGGRPRRLRRSGWSREVNMGSPTTLQDFLVWGMGKHPADRYLLILMGYGDGVRKWRAQPELQGFAGGVASDSSSGGDSLTVAELGEVCEWTSAELGRSLSVVAVDSCFSANVDLAYELAGHVDWLLGSPGLLWNGVPWHQVLTVLCEQPAAGAEHVARTAVEAYADQQSGRGETGRGSFIGLHAERGVELAEALDGLTGRLTGSMDVVWPAVTKARSEARDAAKLSDPDADWFPAMVGLRSFLEHLAVAVDEGQEPELMADIRRTVKAVDGMVIGEQDAGPSIFFPPNVARFPDDYLETSQLAAQTGWGTFLQSYLAELDRRMTPSVPVPDE